MSSFEGKYWYSEEECSPTRAPRVAHGQPGEAFLVDERVCGLDDLVDERLASSCVSAAGDRAHTTKGGWASSLPAMWHRQVRS